MLVSSSQKSYPALSCPRDMRSLGAHILSHSWRDSALYFSLIHRKCYLTVLISMIINEFEQLYRCLWALWVSSFTSCLWCLLPIFLLGFLPVPTDFRDFCELSVTVLSNPVASNHMQGFWVLKGAGPNWDVKSVKYTWRLGGSVWKRKAKFSLIIFFLLITRWNGNLLDRPG